MYDVIIIGAGASGAAIARELSRYQGRFCVLEKEADICCGTSKANSGIVHAGFDAKEGSLMAKLNVKGNKMMENLSKELDFSYKKNGSLVVCTNESEVEKLNELLERGKRNGVEGLQILDRESKRCGNCKRTVSLSGTILCTGKRGGYLLRDIQSKQWDCSCRI